MAVAPRGPSQSAMLTAAARALHRDQGPPLVLDDPLALGLAGAGGFAMIERVRAHLTPRMLQAFARWVAARGRFTEDLVAEAVEEGVGQYVILGAGLDSFAYRHPRLLERLRVFEVDHPASQAWKRNRLAELGVTAGPNVVFAAVDFEAETLRDGLQRAGFDYGALAVFSWIGVTMYLTSEAIRTSLQAVAGAAPGSLLVMTYNQPFESIDEFSRQVTSELAAVVGQSGEPFVSLFTPQEAHGLLVDAGFVALQDFGPEEAMSRYFESAPETRIAGAQRVLVARVA